MAVVALTATTRTQPVVTAVSASAMRCEPRAGRDGMAQEATLVKGDARLSPAVDDDELAVPNSVRGEVLRTRRAASGVWAGGGR